MTDKIYKETLKELTHELDANCGSLLVNKMTLTNLETELGRISEDVLNTDHTDMTAMAMRFNDISHTIQLLSDLLHYTLKEIDENLDTTQIIKEPYVDLLVRGNGAVE